jgi:hypothetical protein
MCSFVCRHIDDAKSPTPQKGEKKSSSQPFANDHNAEPLMRDPREFRLISVSIRPCLVNWDHWFTLCPALRPRLIPGTSRGDEIQAIAPQPPFDITNLLPLVPLPSASAASSSQLP